jgi:Tfp pilus assembly protein PilV
VESILRKYLSLAEAKAADRRYMRQDQASQSAKPVNYQASWRIYVLGQETLLTEVQSMQKRQLESNLETRVRELKNRMIQASRTRRQAIKAKKTQGQQTQATPSR